MAAMYLCKVHKGHLSLSYSTVYWGGGRGERNTVINEIPTQLPLPYIYIHYSRWGKHIW